MGQPSRHASCTATKWIRTSRPPLRETRTQTTRPPPTLEVCFRFSWKVKTSQKPTLDYLKTEAHTAKGSKCWISMDPPNATEDMLICKRNLLGVLIYWILAQKKGRIHEPASVACGWAGAVMGGRGGGQGSIFFLAAYKQNFWLGSCLQILHTLSKSLYYRLDALMFWTTVYMS